MFVKFNKAIDVREVDEFLNKCTNEFLNLSPDCAPTLTFSTKIGEISVFAFEQNAGILAFFSDILASDSARFHRMAQAYARAQPNLTMGGTGWVITRFAGAEHLSLQLGNEIYVRRIPKGISKSIVYRAKMERRFLDCSVETGGHNAQGAMPLALAQTLAG